MAGPDVVSRNEWLKARRALLAEEKALTRRRDALAGEVRRRRGCDTTTVTPEESPWVS